VNELSLVADQVKTSAEFDGILREHAGIDQLVVHLNGGTFLTRGTQEWGDSDDPKLNPGFRAGRQWTFDSESGATLAWDFGAVPDEYINNVPNWLITSTEARFVPGVHSPEETWALLPRGQAIRKLNFDLQYSKAVARWKAKGAKLRIGAAILSGHEAAIEDVHITNYGAWGQEVFPLVIDGGIGQPDRNAIALLDPALYIFDAGIPDDQCSHITGCTVDGYCEDSNDQVTVRMIVGNSGEIAPDVWRQHFRAFAYQSGNHTIATGKNIVQCHTIYQSLRGRIDNNSWTGVQVGVYGDYCTTKGLNVLANEGDANYGMEFFLSPTAGASKTFADQFSHENYIIGPNKLASKVADVRIDTLGPSTATRFIRNISVDASLSLSNNGATNVTRTGTPTKKGCSPFGWFHR
jgi:hypothetical protein